MCARPGAKRKTVPQESYEALRKELEEKDRALAEQAVDLAILRKNEWGFVGEIKGRWLCEEQKIEILLMIEQAKEKGLTVTRSCVFLAN